MISVPVEDLAFIICALMGGALLLITVIFDDIVGGLLDVFNIDIDIGGSALSRRADDRSAGKSATMARPWQGSSVAEQAAHNR